MEITVTGKHLQITEAIEDHARDKASRMDKYFNGVQRIEIVAEQADDHTFEVEFIAHLSGHDHFVAQGRQADLYNAIDDATHKMERQLTDHKEKVSAH